MSQDNKRNFILHGSILAMAGIFVRIIGMVYRIPVLNIIGSEGNGIYVTAYNVHNTCAVIIWTSDGCFKADFCKVY